MHKQLGFTLWEAIIATLVVAGGIGWVANIVKAFGETFDPLTAMAVLRVVGIFVPPVGAVLGYL